MKLLIGADPEVFVKHKGKFVSGFDMIPGTKKDPYAVPFGAVQVDGMALEYNIEPAKNSDDFIHNIASVLNTLSSMIPKDHEIDISPVAKFDPDYIKSQPFKARDLGCDPDFNAYDEMKNESPSPSTSMRTAAGHVHLGWVGDGSGCSFEQGCRLTKQLDFSLGLLGVLYEEDNERRQMYGKAGSFRLKPYGIEYRVLSNFWISDPDLAKVVYDQACMGFWDLVYDNKEYFTKYGELARIAINTHDKDKADTLCKELGWRV